MKKIIVFPVLLLFFIHTKAQIDKNVEITVKGNSHFAFRMYKKISADNENNILFSPYGISQSMAMVFAGTQGKAANQIANTFRFYYKSEDIAKIFNSITNTISTPENGTPTLNIANSLWIQKDYLIHESTSIHLQVNQILKPIRNKAEKQ